MLFLPSVCPWWSFHISMLLWCDPSRSSLLCGNQTFFCDIKGIVKLLLAFLQGVRWEDLCYLSQHRYHKGGKSSTGWKCKKQLPRAAIHSLETAGLSVCRFLHMLKQYSLGSNKIKTKQSVRNSYSSMSGYTYSSYWALLPRPRGISLTCYISLWGHWLCSDPAHPLCGRRPWVPTEFMLTSAALSCYLIGFWGRLRSSNHSQCYLR